MKYTLLLSSLALVASAAQAIPNPIETIRIKQGDTRIIELKLNPAIGNIWNLRSLGKENVVKIEELSSHFYDPFCLGLQAWKVTAKFRGNTQATFEQKDARDLKSVKTKTFNFIVE